MKPKFKNIIIFFFLLILVYGIFVFVDYTRLKNSDFDTKPLIVLKTNVSLPNESNNYVEYIGLGYSVKYPYTLTFTKEGNLEGNYTRKMENEIFSFIMFFSYVVSISMVFILLRKEKIVKKN